MRSIVIGALLLGATQCAAPATTTPATSSAAGCRQSLHPGSHTLSDGGLRRRYLLALPQGKGPHPVVLNLHGLGSSAAEQAAYSRLPQTGAARGYIVATPQVADGRTGWTLPHTYGPDDTAFLTRLLDLLEQQACGDRRREFAAGMSYGAGMATALVCGMGGRLAGVAPVAGLNIVPPCPEAKPTTIIAFHGDADRVVPYRGGHPFQDATGRMRALADLVTLRPVTDAAARWARILGCGTPRERPAGAGVSVRAWQGCRLSLYTIKGGGHTWPGPITVERLGATATGLDATRLILDAFDDAPAR